jgi:SP family general alpha glucoside:H+ symporter-like MFS transporter
MLPSADFDEKKILPGADGTDNAVTTQDDSRALIDAAIAVAEYEKTLSFSQIFKLYWKGAVWSIVLSLALVMEGMDTGLVSLLVL